MRYVFALLLTAAIIFPGPAFAENKLGGKYELVGSLDKLKGAKQIEMLEFFNYSCGHCYEFLKTSKKLHAKYKGKLIHKKYPIYWQKQTPYPSMAYYITDELGIEEKFTQDLFDVNFKYQMNIFIPRVLNALAQEHGIQKQMAAGMQSEKIKAKVQESLALSKQYDVKGTPTVIINEVLRISPTLFEATEKNSGVKQMTENLDKIFAEILGMK